MDLQKQSKPALPQPEKTNNNKNMIIIIIVAAVLVLAIGGYFGWKYYSNNLKSKADNTATPLSPSPSATTSPIITPKVSPTISPTVAPSSSPSASFDPNKKTITTDYVIADSNTREISESELVKLTPWELKVARNEIYARHGRPFVHKDLQCYFAQKSWYTLNPGFLESSLTTTENKNIATIQIYEQKISSPLINKDTGC